MHDQSDKGACAIPVHGVRLLKRVIRDRGGDCWGKRKVRMHCCDNGLRSRASRAANEIMAVGVEVSVRLRRVGSGL